MVDLKKIPDHRKRKRRRPVQRPPIAAFLQPSEQLKGNIGLLSNDLCSELLGRLVVPSESAGQALEHHYVGISPLTHDASVEDSAWTILPVRPRTAREEDQTVLNTIELPSSASALQSLARGIQNKPSRKSNVTDVHKYEIRLVGVQPLKLDTIYVAVDGDALKKHEEVQRRFGGGFIGGQANGCIGKGKKAGKTNANEHFSGTRDPSFFIPEDDELTAAIRQALTSSIVARQGDLLPLPLPAHPITHVPFPPAQIILSEPVNQGLPSNATKIVVHRIHQTTSAEAEPQYPHRPLPVLSSSKSLTDFDITDGDGTSNEAFHSAIEDGSTSDSDVREVASESDELDGDFDELSDDSAEDMITMRTPSLAVRSSGMMSSKTAATPRANARANVTSTPGSMFSNMTSAAARQRQSNNGRPFIAQGLLQRISDESLHPRPAMEDDEECRVFVDIKILVRLGCFSGDWVQLEVGDVHTKEHTLTSAFSSTNELSRPVKIYGLPDLQSAAVSRSAGGMPQTRRSSALSTTGLATATPSAWLSPVLLANFGQPKLVKIRQLLDPSPERPLSRSKTGKPRIDGNAIPPVAREMTLLKVPTPLSTEMSVQSGQFLALKQYFEVKRRILQQGDLIAIPYNANASRLLHQSNPTSGPEGEDEELMNLPETISSGIAWFKVGSIVGPEPLEASEMATDIWRGAKSIEMKTTRMVQAGSEQSKIPSTSTNPWEYYYGIRIKPACGLVYGSTRLAFSMPKPHVSDMRRRLLELMAAATSSQAIHLRMGPVAILLHSTQRSIGKAHLAISAASDLGLHVFSIDAYDLLAEGSGGGDVKSEGFFSSRIDRALSCGANFTPVLVRHIEALTTNRMAAAIKKAVQELRVFIATTTEIDKVPEAIRGLFTHELEVTAPDEDERRDILKDIVQERGLRIASDVDLAAVAVKTAALVAGNLVDIVERAVIARQDRLQRLASLQRTRHRFQSHHTVHDVLVAGGEAVRCLNKADFELAVEAARKNFADAIGAPKIPNVSWEDVGGLENVKDAVMETIQLPLERPELFAKGMKKRSGILFYGPPGTGKTLLAKAIATEFSLNFFSIKGPELLNMYIGESEANVRRVFQRARDARPCVVFFDELDSVAPKRGNQGDSGGVMDRIVSQLLAELDGMSDGDEGGGGVFVIGATNRPDLLDQALLRPGRFDKMLYLGVSDTHDKQITILEALTRKFRMHPDLSLRRVAELLSFTYTGADLYALCSDAMLKAITRQASAVDAKIKSLPGGPVTTAYFFDHLAREEDIAVMVAEDDFAAAQRELVPSVRYGAPSPPRESLADIINFTVQRSFNIINVFVVTLKALQNPKQSMALLLQRLPEFQHLQTWTGIFHLLFLPNDQKHQAAIVQLFTSPARTVKAKAKESPPIGIVMMTMMRLMSPVTILRHQIERLMGLTGLSAPWAGMMTVSCMVDQ